MIGSIKHSAKSVLDSLESAVISNATCGYTKESIAVTGLTIWLPDVSTFNYTN